MGPPGFLLFLSGRSLLGDVVIDPLTPIPPPRREQDIDCSFSAYASLVGRHVLSGSRIRIRSARYFVHHPC